MTRPDLFDADRVGEEAAQWAVRSAEGSLPAHQLEELDRWLAADRRHQGAYLRARAALKVMDRALHATPAERQLHGDNDNERKSIPLAPERRQWRFAAGGMALAASVAALMVAHIHLPAPPAQPTEQVVAMNTRILDDGSRVELGQGGRIEVAMSSTARRISLEAGEASFQVARDPARPFIVRSGAVYAQATGTVYSVRRVGRMGGAVEVSEGSVLVWLRDERDNAVLLHAGDKLTFDPALRNRKPPPNAQPAVQPEIARISLDNVSVAAAVSRFNRINRTQIVIEDDRVGETTIVGLFKADDPQRFAQAVATITDTVAVNEGEMIVIKMK